jgi:hypothetical protein
MTGDGKGRVDRRRALGLIAGATVAAAAAGVPKALRGQTGSLSGKSDADRRPEPIRVRVKKGSDARDPRLDELFRDGLTAADLPATRRAIAEKTRSYMKAMVVSRRPTPGVSLAAKQAMRAAENEMLDIADRLANGALSTSQARVAAKSAFARFVDHLKGVGVR